MTCSGHRQAPGPYGPPQTQRRRFPNGCCVLVKRFTAKGEKSGAVAGVYDPVDGYGAVAFENHLNVIHRDHAPLPRPEAEALAEFLNSDLVDTYFRMFSGSTQVNGLSAFQVGVRVSSSAQSGLPA